MIAGAPAITVASGLPVRVCVQVRRGLDRRLRRLSGRLGISPAQLASVAVHVVTDRTMARLNREHMGKRGPTDVLSFPSAEAGFFMEPGGVEQEPPRAPEPTLGDIVLCWPAVTRQASGPGLAAQLDEATVLVVHGLAHLLGHDHRRRGEGRVMHRLERRALAAVGVADIRRPYGLRPSGGGR